MGVSIVFSYVFQTNEKVKLEINSDKKIDLIVSYFSLPSNESECVKAQIAQKLLKYSYTNNDKISEALSLNEISYFYGASNKRSEGLAICLKALKIAEKVENEKLIGYINAKLSFFYEDFNKSYSFLKKSLNIANRIKDDNLKLETYKKLSELFLQNNKINQSLQFTQKEYELTLKLKKLQEIGYTYLGFAEIQDIQICIEALEYVQFFIDIGETTEGTRLYQKVKIVDNPDHETTLKNLRNKLLVIEGLS